MARDLGISRTCRRQGATLAELTIPLTTSQPLFCDAPVNRGAAAPLSGARPLARSARSQRIRIGGLDIGKS